MKPITNLTQFKENILSNITSNKIIFYFSWFLCFSIALPHHIFPGKAGAISIIIFILWLYNGNLKNKLLILKHSKLFLYLTLFILILVISLSWSENTDFGIRRLYAFKYYFLLIPVFITSFTKYESMSLIHAFILGCILHATLMILQTLNVIPFSSRIELYSPYSSYSTFFVFSSFYCFYFFQHHLKKKNKLKQISYLLFTLLFIYVLFTNPARSGQLAFIISAVLTLFLLHHNLKKTIILFSIFTILITTIILSSEKVQNSYIAAINDIHKIQQENYDGSWGARWGLSITAIDVIKSNPIFGVGVGDTHDVRKQVIEKKIKGSSKSISYYAGVHNNYLAILEAAGIISLIIYLLMYIHIYKLPIKIIEIKNLSLIFLATLVVASFSDDIIFYKPYNIHFAIMIALFINLSLDKKI